MLLSPGLVAEGHMFIGVVHRCFYIALTSYYASIECVDPAVIQLRRINLGMGIQLKVRFRGQRYCILLFLNVSERSTDRLLLGFRMNVPLL